MTLNEKYRYLSRRSNPKLILYLIIAIFFIIATTLAKYTNAYRGEVNIQVAKWNIAVNGETLSNNKSTLDDDIELIPDVSGDGIIRTGDTGYIEIEIDPTGTEVSVEYSIELSFVKNNASMTSSIQFTGYSLNGDNTTHAISNNTISETIDIDEKTQLGSTEKRKYKIYWRCTDPDLDLNTKSCAVRAGITVQQHIS